MLSKIVKELWAVYWHRRRNNWFAGYGWFY